MQHTKIINRKHREQYAILKVGYFTLTDDKRFYRVSGVFLFFHVLTFLTFVIFYICECNWLNKILKERIWNNRATFQIIN